VTTPVDITGYLLGELGPEEAARVTRLAHEDHAVAAEVARLRPIVTRLQTMPDDAWEPVEPPPLDVDLPLATPVRRRVPRMPRLVLRPAVAVACSVLLVGAGAGIGALIAGSSETPAPPGSQVGLTAYGTADPGATGAVKVAADGTGATVTVSGLEPTRDGQYYELWLMNSGEDLVSLGGFQVDDTGHAEVKVPLPADVSAYKYVDVSLEPPDGKPGHSAVSVLRSSGAA
jgi:anti-sigma-K factor RskA